MPQKRKVLRSPSPRQWFPSGSATGGILVLAIVLTACSGLPGFLQPVPETPFSQADSTPQIEATAIGNPPDAAPPSGGYPEPDSTKGGQSSQAKAVTPIPGSFAMYLPLIANQIPPSYPFELQKSGVVTMQGMEGCNWAGVAGLVFDLSDAPLKNLVLHLEGNWAGQDIVMEALSGSKPDPYGASGYEFVLGNQSLASSQTLWIQVRDAAKKEISDRIFLNTYDDCTRNLVLVNFNQVR